MIELLIPSLITTLEMVFFSTIFSLLLGFPIGILLILTEKNGLWEKRILNNILNTIINIFRSIPFIILIILLFPVSKLILGTKIGTAATIIPLSLSATPFVARIMESSFKEVDKGLIELGISMGASNFEIVTRIIIPEALPSIISGITLTIINLISLSAMAGTIGGGGLGDFAIRYGYHRSEPDKLIGAVVVIVILVQIIQLSGDKLAKKVNKKL